MHWLRSSGGMTKLDVDPRPGAPDSFMGKFSLRSVRAYLKINISPVEQFTVKTARPFSNPDRTSVGWVAHLANMLPALGGS